ncbi:uncharacterized protein LOC121326478 isoform X3 [Polyodon spathula]|uniref:uncharacterized protein LOC121326478 isoform X3 n=1 Tax=Polyodon spathula TaxID=7913 RepID=UPI001B7ED7EA|nr:uncharacterized protein LOC121326478 isoform X3 [Polyodon spathula]
MGFLGALGFLLFSVTVIEMSYFPASGLTITEISSPSATELQVKWTPTSGVNYFLDLRVVNSTSIAPIVLFLPESPTERLVGGLRPATVYNVTVKSSILFYVVESTWKLATTVPGTSQIIEADATSSSAIRAQWSAVTGAERYYLIVKSDNENYNLTFSTLQGTVTNLQPTKTYMLSIYSANAGGLGASSKIKTVTTLVPPPTGATLSNIGANAVRIDWQPVDKVILYGVFIYKNENLSSTPDILKTTDTFIVINNLMTCTNYLFGLRAANNFLIFGEESYITYRTGSAVPVTTIQANYSCVDSSSTVTWNPSSGATSYRASATTQNGTTALSCTTKTTSCKITGLKCGAKYTVHVFALVGICENVAESTAVFQTVPCAPINLSIYRDCYSNVVFFYWDRTPNTDFYSAIALGADGVAMECRTTDTSCVFTDLNCGMEYIFRVSSVKGECSSANSAAARARTAPCEPTNMKTIADCQSNTMISSWDSAAGALSYTVEATANTGKRYSCSSFSNSCAMPGVPCGESLSAWIIASDNQCTSAQALGEVAETVPCSPTNVTADSGCSTDSLSVSWSYSSGALMYFATVEGSDGTQHSCAARDTQCQITALECGQSYTVYVTATNLKCNSSRSSTVTVKTAPCSPVLNEAFLECSANLVLVLWNQSPGAESYTATLQSSDGSNLTCNTMFTNCIIPDLKCGVQYMVTVISRDGKCASSKSKSIQMTSVPCIPENIKTRTDCKTGIVKVLWDPSTGAEVHSAIVEAENGIWKYCSSTGTSCDIAGLQCGQSHTVLVMSSNGTCYSQPSQREKIQEVPCAPSNVNGNLDCENNTVHVSWNRSSTATSYTATVTGRNNFTESCSTGNLTCSIGRLQCAEQYNITVLAKNGECSSPQASSASVKTAPCAPTITEGRVDCESNTASVSWVPRNTAVSYTLIARGANGHQVSCSATNTTCSLNGMQCGQTYTAYATAQGGQCESAKSAGYNIVAVPCAPTNVETRLDCGANIASILWAQSKGAVSYTATAKASSGRLFSCNSTGTICNITSLLCGQKYTVTVMGLGNNCNSVRSNATEIETVPCPPQNVNATLDCASKNASVSWSASQGAVSYRVAAVRTDGQTEAACSTQSNNCDVSNLQCGLKYNITVTPLGQKCTGFQSAAFQLASRPCPPTNILTTLDCRTNIGSVSWKHELGAELFIATATENDGHTHTCNASQSTCNFTDLHCGSTYTVTVVAVVGVCKSSDSVGREIKTAPCAPTITAGRVDCESNNASVSWVQRNAAVSYTLTARGANGHQVSCSATNTTCSLNGMQCGQTYTAYATAQGGQCESAMSAGYNIVAVPCAPTNVETRLDCGANIASVLWAQSKGAVSYTATAKASSGRLFSCNSTGTMCNITSLLCGQKYTVTVTGLGNNCNSVRSNATEIETAPCPPQNVNATLDCASKNASVSWSASQGAVSYRVAAVRTDGQTEAACSTQSNNCDVSNLQCGLKYNITVTPLGQKCTGFQSAAFQLASRPCPPTNILTTLDCRTNIGSVYWKHELGAELFIATATENDGHTHTCNASQSTCNFTDLHCGSTYTVTVVAVVGVCKSSDSVGREIKTAPCAPTITAGRVDCESNNASVSWVQRNTAVSYTLTARGANGHQVSCSATSTTCSLNGMQCGQTYTAYATAQGGQCESAMSAGYNIVAVPCAPTNVETRLDCGANIASVLWAQSKGAVSYTATAKASSGRLFSCNSTGTICNITSLLCGQKYTVTVTGLGNNCNSFRSNATEIETAPCPPQNVNATLDCASKNASVSWSASQGAMSYRVAAVRTDGQTEAACSTQSNNCDVSNLQCGLKYNITVTPLGQKCTGFQSAAFQLASRPCPPTNILTTLDCRTNIGSVSWKHELGAELFIATATENDGHTHTCNASQSTCNFTDLHCGSTYTVTVVAVVGVCKSSDSVGREIKTAPCAPTITAGRVDCESNNASVSWVQRNGAVSYTLTARGANGHQVSCSATNTTCSLNGMQCGQTYTAYATAQGGQCESAKSAGYNIVAVPCAPTNVETRLDCGANIASVLWAQSKGAVSYTATAKASSGRLFSCNSTGTICNITSLLCGQKYTVTVTGLGNNCNSFRSNATEIETVPCPPQNVNATLDCASKNASVSWSASQGAMSYRVAAVRTDGQTEAACSTQSNNCDVSNLQCGLKYNITVTPLGQKCTGFQSAAFQLASRPCPPTNILTTLDCRTNIGSVSWKHELGAELFIATATENDGHTHTCNASQSACNFTDLHCGSTYTVTVVAVVGVCKSSDSVGREIKTAPCAPTITAGRVDCESNNASVSWVQRNGAVSYTLTARGANGHQVSCSATNTTCSLNGMQCGQTYTAYATAQGGQCESAMSAGYNIVAVPCAPTNVETRLDCGANIASILWAQSKGAVSYTATAKASSGRLFSCNSTGTICNITSLLCGQKYTVTVTGLGNNCNSFRSNATEIETVPCVPDNLTVQMQCATNSALLSWDQSNRTLQYFVSAIASGGEKLSCNSQKPGCTIDRLTCGTKYNFTVTASNGVCNSSFSVPVIAGAVPCPPQSVALSLLLLVDAVQEVKVGWSAVQCAGVEYSVEMRGLIEDDPQAQFILTSYWTSATYFFIPVPCSSTYNATVTSRNSAGIGYPSPPIQGLAVPCPPRGVTFYTEGTSWVISWNASVYATGYVVYSSKNQRTELCRTSRFSCTVPKKQNDTIEVTAVNSAGESEPSVEILVQDTNLKRRRRDLQEDTGTYKGDLLAPEVHVVSVTGDTLHVEWTPVEGATYYVLIVNVTETKPFKPLVQAVQGSSAKVTGLLPLTQYSIRVSAKDYNRSSQYSDPVLITTDCTSPFQTTEQL